MEAIQITRASRFHDVQFGEIHPDPRQAQRGSSTHPRRVPPAIPQVQKDAAAEFRRIVQAQSSRETTAGASPQCARRNSVFMPVTDSRRCRTHTVRSASLKISNNTTSARTAPAAISNQRTGRFTASAFLAAPSRQSVGSGARTSPIHVFRADIQAFIVILPNTADKAPTGGCHSAPICPSNRSACLAASS